MQTKVNETLNEAVITSVHRTEYLAECNEKVIHLTLAGRFQYLTLDKEEYPVVGDYVNFRQVSADQGVIETVVSRKNALIRSGVGFTGEAQVLASNIDLIFVCMAMDKDFHKKKLQNFLSLTYNTGARVIILLTKKDLATNEETILEYVHMNHKEEVLVVSVYDSEDIVLLENIIAQNTAVFIGSSGVGKSSLINALLNEKRLEVNCVRASDAQGRHTTTHREYIRLPKGGAVIDTPGIRIVQTHIVDELDDAFEEVIMLAEDCKFRDCKHEDEPGCKVKDALQEGLLNEERFNAYKKIVKLNRYHQKRDKIRKKLLEKKSTYPSK